MSKYRESLYFSNTSINWTSLSLNEFKSSEKTLSVAADLRAGVSEV